MVTFANEDQVRTGSTTGTVRLWNVARAPIQGSIARIKLWIQVRSGFELDAAGVLQALDPENWATRKDRLRELGGPPRASIE